jgi:hypothetical protein
MFAIQRLDKQTNEWETIALSGWEFASNNIINGFKEQNNKLNPWHRMEYRYIITDEYEKLMKDLNDR